MFLNDHGQWSRSIGIMSLPRIKVLIGNNSGYSRLVMSDILNSDPGIEVVDTASSGDELLEKARRLRPDVIYLDTDIIKNERFFTLKKIMNECSAPLVVSGSDDVGDAKVMNEAREIGLHDLIIKPYHILQPGLRPMSSEIISIIKSAVTRKPVNGDIKRASFPASKREPRRKASEPTHLVVIGASTGGPQAIESVLRKLRSPFSGTVLIAQHMPMGFTKSFAERLDAVSPVPVVEAKHGMLIEAGRVIVARGDSNMVVASLMGMKNRFRIELMAGTSEYDRPSIDMLMVSAAEAYGERTIGVILSGMGSDGTLGTKAVCEKGGLTFVQDPGSATIYSMGQSALDKGYIHKVLSLHEISSYITRIVKPL
jgi:two-component system, chemotaxis family, protein-glutamate methylesterase/glutaminase